MGETAFSPDGKTLAVQTYFKNEDKHQKPAEESCEARFLNALDGTPSDRKPLPCPPGPIGLKYRSDGGALAWRMPSEIVVWDLKTARAQCTLPVGVDGDSDEPFAFAPNGKTLTARIGRTLHRWDLSTGKDVYPDVSGRGHNAPIVAVAWSPDGSRIATMSQGFEASLCLWDAETGQLLRTLPASERWWFGGHWLVFAPDGARLFAAGGDGVVHCWDASSGKAVWSGRADDRGDNTEPLRLDGFRLTADGARLLTLSLLPSDRQRYGPAVEIEWDAATGERPPAVGRDTRVGRRRLFPRWSAADS